MLYLGITVFVLALLAGWTLTLFSLPGNWLIVVSAAVYAWLVPDELRWDIGWWTVLALVVLALLGEALEFAAGALGAARVGGSKRGAALAIVGSMAGAVAGAMIGLPIPVVGSVVAAIAFAGVGAMLGAMLGETWKGRSLGQSWKVGQGAFWGRMLGTLAKTIVGSAMVAVGLVALVAP